MSEPTLVIGIGNELRGDDAAGLIAVRRVARERPGIRVRYVHQLTADMALGLGDFETVVFVDAEVGINEPCASQVVPSPRPPAHDPHRMSPAQLLSIAKGLDEPLPRQAHQVGLPARSFDHGAPLSSLAESGLKQGVALVREVIDSVLAKP